MNEFKIQWMIGNRCNFDCVYCPSTLKEGLSPEPTLESFELALNNIRAQTTLFEIVNIDLTGGEPTLYDAVKTSLVSDTGKLKFSFHSNGTADLSWWESALPNLNEITLSLHPQVDFEHFTSVASLLDKKCKLKIMVVMPESEIAFDLQKSKYQVLKDRFEVIPQMLYKNFTKGNNEYFDYTEDRWTWYFSETGINPKNNFDLSTTVEFKRINKTNEYTGNLCWAGHTQIVIDPYGWAFRGWCRVNDALGNVYANTLVLDRKPRVCPKQLCTNGFDLAAKKSDSSWGFS